MDPKIKAEILRLWDEGFSAKTISDYLFIDEEIIADVVCDHLG